MNNISSGLFLPIRVYDSLEQQDRFKNQAKGVALTELNYVYVDCVALAPFQIIYAQVASAQSVSMKAVCVDSGEEIPLPFTAVCWEEYIDVDDQIVHESYLGNDNFSGYLWNGLYYLVITIVDAEPVTRLFYSDLFMIGNCTSPDDLNEYRIYDSDQTHLRITDNVDDFRIV